ncbi:LysR family transcriptional regulator [Oxalobacter sp. OttesenSCG-928-P03]|nr:LysR family transcriptional regulator [Oxalobacter sp. OttesenSCG-928-P03]
MKIDDEITLRKLFIFSVFMEKGNIARTAEALGMSAVSVHRALHTLEAGLRCPLFVRKGRNLATLPAAHTLLEYSQKAIRMLERGLEETRRDAGYGHGRLRVGTLYSLTLETVPRLIMGIKLRRPELEFDLTMGSNRMLVNMLEDGELDAILINTSAGEIDASRFEALPVLHDEIYLAVPASAELDRDLPVDLSGLSGEKFVSLAEGFATSANFREAFEKAGFEPDIAARVNDIFSMISLVQAGVGYTLLPGRMKGVYESGIQLLRLAEPYRMRQTIAIVFAKNREMDPNLLALAAEGRMYARTLEKRESGSD